jgi:hypothetical protein
MRDEMYVEDGAISISCASCASCVPVPLSTPALKQWQKPPKQSVNNTKPEGVSLAIFTGTFRVKNRTERTRRKRL